jgi:hypothetical protein
LLSPFIVIKKSLFSRYLRYLHDLLQNYLLTENYLTLYLILLIINCIYICELLPSHHRSWSGISWYRKGLSKSIIIALICKKKRNQQGLSEEEEKEYNKIHSKKRIVIENTILRWRNTGLWVTYSEINWENITGYIT